MKQTTLGVLIKDGKIFLGEKKRGFAKGVLNGVGGKKEEGETIQECMIREAKEEIGIDIKELEKIGIMYFRFQDNSSWDQDVNIFLIKDYTGEIIETQEIRPFWFDLDDIPYDKMWKDDIYWLPRVLNNEKDIEYQFYFDKENGDILKLKKIK